MNNFAWSVSLPISPITDKLYGLKISFQGFSSRRWGSRTILIQNKKKTLTCEQNKTTFIFMPGLCFVTSAVSSSSLLGVSYFKERRTSINSLVITFYCLKLTWTKWYLDCIICVYTLQRVSGEAELADDVSGDVCLDPLTNFSLTFCNFKPLIKLFRVKLLSNYTKTYVSQNVIRLTMRMNMLIFTKETIQVIFNAKHIISLRNRTS